MTDFIECRKCGLTWSLNPEDYPGVRNEEYIVCSCGTLLLKKSELFEDENVLLQPA